MTNLIIAHKTELSLGAAWLFSAWMSSMPPVDPTKLSFPVRWLLSFAQFLAANLHKV
jgi:hypothetical protein